MNAPPRDRDDPSLPANEEQKPDDLLGAHTATLGDALGNGPAGELPNLPNALSANDTLVQSIKDGYPNDPML